MLLVIAFETIFAYLRSYLILIITARVDIRLSEYMFDKVLRLPIDYFERTQVGVIGHDMNEICRIRSLPDGAVVRYGLGLLTLFVLPAGDVFLQSGLDGRRRSRSADLIVLWLVADAADISQGDGRRDRGRDATRRLPLSDARGHADHQVARAGNRGNAQQWDVHVAKTAKLQLREGHVATVIQSGVRPLERLAVNGSYALGVYFAMTTKDPVYIGALFAFLMLSQRVSGPLMQMAQLDQSVRRSAGRGCHRRQRWSISRRRRSLRAMACARL